jgi:hypothetical protein
MHGPAKPNTRRYHLSPSEWHKLVNADDRHVMNLNKTNFVQQLVPAAIPPPSVADLCATELPLPEHQLLPL